jgi:uracil-DNA glycosylase
LSLASIDEPQRKEVLKSICTVNVKKTPGAGTAGENELDHIADEDERFLKKQFALYSPDLVICCGQVPANVHYRCQDANALWQVTSRGQKYWLSSTGTAVIQFFHPQARKSKRNLYGQLIDAAKEIMQVKYSAASVGN